MKFCPECGAKLVGDAPKFCGECGHKLVTVEAIPAERPNSELSDEELRTKPDAGDAGPQMGRVKDMSETELGEAEEASTDPERLAELAASEETLVRGGVARNPSTPLAVLTRLADDPEVWVCLGLAGNPSTPEEILTRLSEDSYSKVRQVVAGNPSTPVEVLARLAEDPDHGVRMQIYHPAPGSSQLAALAAIGNGKVRSGVAASFEAPVEVLSGLATDQEASVRENVAGNILAPTGVVAELASNDPCFPVRKRALLNPVCPNDVREASGLVFLFAIGANYCDGDIEVFPLSDHEIACDLVAVERFPTEVDDDLAAYEILVRILGDPDYNDGDGGYQERTVLIVSAGRGAPDWWNDWSLIKWPEIRGSNTRIEDALNRDSDELFIQAMGDPGDDADENVEGMAITVAFSGRESLQQAWAQIWADVESAVRNSSEQLQGLADRWLAQADGDDRPELVQRFIEGALARNPASPPNVLRQMATADDAGLRWLVTRNPGASDEVKALAALSLSADERFEQRVPDSDLRIFPDAFSLGVRGRVWSVQECPTSTGWEGEAAQDLFDGTGPGGVVYSFTSEFVDPDEDDDW